MRNIIFVFVFSSTKFTECGKRRWGVTCEKTCSCPNDKGRCNMKTGECPGATNTDVDGDGQ